MKHYHFHPSILLRTPALSYRQARKFTLQQLVRQRYFQQALAYSGKTLIALLEQADYEISRLKPKAVQTLSNYQNRIHYRTVPFALFSGFSVLRWGQPGQPDLKIRLGKRLLHLLPDFEHSYREQIGQPAAAGKLYYFKNPSLYQSGDTYRYFHPELQTNDTALSFSLASSGQLRLLRLLPDHDTLSPDQWTAVLHAHFEGTQEEAAQLTQDLIHAGILLPLLPEQQLGNRTGWSTIELTTPGAGTWSLPSRTHKPPYTSLERPVTEGALPSGYQDALIWGLTALQKLVVSRDSTEALRQFQQAFRARFEEQLVPLLVAIDPELGVGYAGLETATTESALVAGLALNTPAAASREVHWTQVHTLLLKYMMDNPTLKTKGIQLEEKDLAGLPLPEDALPSGMSVLFRTTGSQVYIESAGGATATALPGRFSLVQEDMEAALKEIAQNEIRNNPDVVFAELESVQDLHVANVERRPAFYDYKIPILTDTDTEGHTGPAIIALEDLRIACRGDRVLLWSRSLNKEVVPRLSTAFNYQRSPLSVYRILCDLQHQGIRTGFHLDLSQYFPDQPFYPRVSYGPAILSLACWKLRRDDLRAIHAATGSASKAQQLQALLSAKGCPPYVALSQGDLQLVYDLREEDDLLQLWGNISRQEAITLQEFPFAENASRVTDAEGAPYIAQYIASLFHTRVVYPGRTTGFAALVDLYDRPRTDPNWLYLRIHLHAAEANALLLDGLYPLVSQVKAMGLASQWFFIRYNDPDSHIRLRLYTPDQEAKNQVAHAVYQLLQPYTEKGLISRLITDNYQQELERYAPASLSLIEAVFDADSDWAIALLALPVEGEDAAMRLAFASASYIIDTLLDDAADKIALCRATFESLLQEHHGAKATRQYLAALYDRIIRSRPEALPALPPSCLAAAARYALQARAIRDNHPREAVILCGHLVHMHLNRYFPDTPRKQEMMVYYLMLRHYQAGAYQSSRIEEKG